MKNTNSLIELAIRFKPDRIVLGELKQLSRRRARKLAYQYRGGKRAQRYQQYLSGQADGFWLCGKRLVRFPQFGPGIVHTFHADSVAANLSKLGFYRAYSIEYPPEICLHQGKQHGQELGSLAIAGKDSSSS